MNRLASVPFFMLAWAACGVEPTTTQTYQPGAPDASAEVQDASADTAQAEASQADVAATDASADIAASDAPAQDAAWVDVDFSYDVAVVDQGTCAETVVEGRQTTLAMYVMLDRSGSMTFANKWATAIDGISQFVTDPGVAGMNAALQYFPLESGHDCAGGGYAVPEVGMGLLPAHATAIVSSLQNQTPAGATTPIEGALRGIVQYARSYASTPPGSTERVIGVLMTDGLPDSSCDSDTQALAAIAADAVQGQPSIPIYVMGMSGADFSVLSEIAAAGGTTAAYSVTSGGAAAFLTALQEIRADAVGCDFPLPSPDAGVIDPDQVKVVYTPGVGNPQTLTHQPGLGACGSGWYYDDNASPTKVTLCPSTCQIVHQDTKARVDISLGCLGA